MERQWWEPTVAAREDRVVPVHGKPVKRPKTNQPAETFYLLSEEYFKFLTEDDKNLVREH